MKRLMLLVVIFFAVSVQAEIKSYLTKLPSAVLTEFSVILRQWELGLLARTDDGQFYRPDFRALSLAGYIAESIIYQDSKGKGNIQDCAAIVNFINIRDAQYVLSISFVRSKKDPEAITILSGHCRNRE